MPQPARGELRPLASGWEARIRIDDEGNRKGFLLATIAKDDKAGARERCDAMADIAVRLRRAGHAAEIVKLLELAARSRAGKSWDAIIAAVDALCGGKTEAVSAKASKTFGELALEWTSGKLHNRFPDHVDSKRTSDEDEGRFRKWIFPVLEHVALHAVTVAHAQEVLRRIPSTASRSTRRHVGQLMSRVLNLAVYPCELIERSPLPKGFLPKLGKGKALQYLYPSEDATLLAADDERVPLVHRLFYGFLAREGMRSDEAQLLSWSDLDLERGAVRLDKNKSDDPRAWALDPGVVRALTAWKKMHADDEPTDRVFRGLDKPYNLPLMLREHLRAAGVTRAELFERTEARRPIRIHDLRATMITVHLANGKTESWIADRTGHTSSEMINRYRRAARTFAELGQGPLTPLDEALGLPHERPTGSPSGSDPSSRESVIPDESENPALPVIAAAAFGSSYRGSNPCAGTGIASRSRRETLESRAMRRFTVRAPLVALSLIVVHVACGGSSSDDAKPTPDDGADADVDGEDVDAGDDAAADGPADAGAKCIFKSFNPNAPAPCVGTTRKLGTRPYCLHVPSSYEAGKAMPLVVLLHGYSADGQHQATYFDFDTAAERHGFILAKPDGLKDGLGQRYWNAFSSCCADPNDASPPDDVAYLSDLVADVKGGFAVDAKRVYAVGHSNGGFMAHRLGCDRAATFAAVVSVAGAVDPANCSPSEHVSVLEVHGDADTIVEYGGGNTPGNPNPYPSVDTTLSTWAQKNGCTGARGATGKIDILCETGFPGDETAVEAYASCPAGIDVSLWRIHQGDHLPNFLVPWWGDRVWSFLEAHPKP